ncbi:hypothetical protein AO1008_10739 [Aspergillus oryzae 100-8]|uniref:Azaphilone pigments biosynthesis cluster protein L N-terminal domain-containing protein n=1 Tax=Aspergillus oryzae (strain 3.042) TaxID=1160506 RepID=I8TRT5_ASPO3|nr:hypothetical protein Ao3042_06811 [Aspergillus oryzae 3.042]KDE84145.1 hypothetical protein AO1008_10739 [Aspergillus oryzae 100-8]|eukprot:EIT76975.1 hypothetical protein Ao3042_06811 [Aspergillus oryzae 3.042]
MATSPDSSAADILTLTKLAWDLYHNCYLITSDAPEAFKQLVNELASLQGVLRALRDDVNSNASFFDDLEEGRRNTLQRCLNACSNTLQNVKEVVAKYRNLGVGDGKQFWQRVKWVSQRGEIDDLKSRIMIHTCNLSLCMSSIGNSTLARIERSMADALEQKSFPSTPETLSNGQRVLRTPPIPGDDDFQLDESLRIEPLRVSPKGIPMRANSLPTVESHARISASESILSGGSEWSATTVNTTSPSINDPLKRSMSHNYVVRRTGSCASESRHLRMPSSESAQLGIHPALREEPFLDNRTESSGSELDNTAVTSAVATAMQQLQQVQIRESILRPLRYEPRDKLHRPDPQLMRSFDALVRDELRIKRLSTSDWLRVAVWWLLKGIKDEFAHFISLDVPEYSIIQSQNLDIWEPLQPEEAAEKGSDSIIGLNNVRWATVDLEDAGDEEEKVFYRTFVNAGIGSKRLRMRTKGAPYMLLLSAREGESEPKITICNQSGTLCLQRDFLPEDLAQMIRVWQATVSGYPGMKISEPIVIRFDTKSVSVSFQHASDLQYFINLPKAYFDAVWQREPVDSDQFSETVLFRSSVEKFEQLKAPTMRPMNPPVIHKSCEVRILERSYGEAWQSVRRMVISSWVAEQAPWCIELFMPMSRVQVCRGTDSGQILVKWSDTCQERSTKTDGNYHPLYSYVYDDNSPNIGLGLQFRSQKQVEDFEKAILSMCSQSSFSWDQPTSSGYVYDVVDPSGDQKQYKAILLIQSRLTWKYCSLYYVYRDTDYVYDHRTLRVRFPRLFYTDYISSHVDRLYPADRPVSFSHCEKKVGNMTAEFDEEPLLRSFMSSLANGYELLYSRRAVSLVTKGKSLFGARKSNKGETEVQLWRKGASIQMSSRWDEHVTDKWLTVSVMPGALQPAKDSTRVDFSTLQYSRGSFLNMAGILAVAPKDPNMARRGGQLAINFATSKDRHDFVAALECDSVPPAYDV